MANLNFDANTVAPQEALEPIPAGWYTALIESSEMKLTKAQDAEMLVLTLKVIEGPYTNRKIFTRLNIQAANPVAKEIAHKQLSAICHSIGKLRIQRSEELHGVPLQVKLSLRPAGAGKDGSYYDASNEVKGFKAVEGNSGVVNATAAPSWAQPAVPPTQQAAAWQMAPAQAPVQPPQQPAPVQPPQQQTWQQTNAPTQNMDEIPTWTRQN